MAKMASSKRAFRVVFTTIGCSFISRLLRRGSVLDLAPPPFSGYWATGRPPNSRQDAGATLRYGVPDGAPAICQAKASGEDAVRNVYSAAITARPAPCDVVSY